MNVGILYKKLKLRDRPFAWRRLACKVMALGLLATAAAHAEKNSSAELEVGSDEFDQLGEQLTGQVCTQACHGWEAIFGGPRRVPMQWDSLVSDMKGRGAAASDEELQFISQFLKWAWGTVWINSASAEDLEAVLALTKDDARTVISFRQEHGKFADLDSLRKIPGIDTAAIVAQPDAINFN